MSAIRRLVQAAKSAVSRYKRADGTVSHAAAAAAACEVAAEACLEAGLGEEAALLDAQRVQAATWRPPSAYRWQDDCHPDDDFSPIVEGDTGLYRVAR